MSRCLSIFLLIASTPFAFAQQGPALRTVAESSNYQQTSTSAQVREFCTELAKQSPVVRLTDIGTSHGGRKLQLLILSDPPIATPQETEKAKKPVLLVYANIHAGEIDGKEAVLALARDLTLPKADPLLKKVVVLIVPNLNPDGNDRIDKNNRTEQNGPVGGVGVRANDMGLDLNRDFVKLETPEIRTLVKLFAAWDPLLIVDCHTTNGSYHRYPLTYDGPRHPSTHKLLKAFAQETLLPDVAARVKKATSFDTFLYGDFDKTHTKWETSPGLPRFGVHYASIRGHIGILSESYSYAPYKDRVKASNAFVRANLESAVENLDKLKSVMAESRLPLKSVAVRVKSTARDKKSTVFAYVEEVKNGKVVSTGKPKDYECEILDQLVSTLSVEVPSAYLLPTMAAAAVETLRRHGIVVEELLEDIEIPIEPYRITEVNEAEKAFQGHKLRTLEVRPGEAATRRVSAGTFVVRTDQRLGTLAAYLLEPQAEDGLAAWNQFDALIEVGREYPVLRVAKLPPLFTGTPRPLPEDRKSNLPITTAMVGGFGFPGVSLPAITWLPDGEHWLQVKEKKLWKVHARSGKAELFVDPVLLLKSLAEVKGIPPDRMKRLVETTHYTFDLDHTGVLLDTGSGLVFAYRDGKAAVRLTKEAEHEFPSFSPNGKRVAFVRGGNLFAVDIATGKERKLTNDGGSKDILNARADWVYEEEIFDRNGKAYWWSPDSTRIAFLRFDDQKVPKFNITDSNGTRGKLETISYPKPGDPNPLVTIGVVNVIEENAKPTFLNLEGYPADSTLISRVGWEKSVPFAYLQNREQTWLDFVVWPDVEGKSTKLLRETTKAWVEDLGEPKWLDDDSFLILSERSGWKHIYHYASDGKLIAQLTDGKWEVKSIERVDTDTGDIYFMSSKVSPTGAHLCLTNVKTHNVRVISDEATTHRISLAPKGSLYIDTESDDRTPARSTLRELYVKEIRKLNTNPAYERDAYRFGEYKRTKISMKDGFELEAGITYPPDFHPDNFYPIWILTYAGPHAPTVRDGWGNGRLIEQILASMGVVVLRVDPRSASGKGAESAWTCYKQLGVQELKDLEEATDWILKNKWADPKRVGLSGHSYGGFMAAYALTYSKKFAAGIAGAPVTDWHLYDTIYTERYMGLPSNNKDGYEKTSVVKAAANLHGKLLIVHGLIDDNVHAQNSHQLIQALQKADKEFEVMVYPGDRHGIAGKHYPKTQLNFIRRVFELK